MWLTVGGDTVLHCDMGVGAVVGGGPAHGIHCQEAEGDEC